MSIYWVGSINYLPIWSCGELADYAVDHYISYLLSTTRDALTSFQISHTMPTHFTMLFFWRSPASSSDRAPNV